MCSAHEVFLLIRNLSFPRLSSNCYQAVSWSLLKLHGAAGRELVSAEAAGSSGWCLLGQGSRELWPVLGSSFYQWVSGGILTEIEEIGKTKTGKTISSVEHLVLSAGA